jgi:hypothetical protein
MTENFNKDTKNSRTKKDLISQVFHSEKGFIKLHHKRMFPINIKKTQKIKDFDFMW